MPDSSAGGPVVVRTLLSALNRGARRLAPEYSVQRRAIREGRRAQRVLVDEGPAALGRLLVRQLDPRVSDVPLWEDRRYRRWLRGHGPTRTDLGEMHAAGMKWTYRPLVSVVVPVYNPRVQWLDAMVRSVRDQAYENWELCLADDLSPNPHVRVALERWAAAEPRVRLVFRSENGNIAAASNSALEVARGEFVALLDHDDVLQPHALHRCVEALQADDDVDVLYSDEDKILLNGQRGAGHLKGEFDPDYLLSTNYMCHLAVIRRALMTEIGGFRAGLDGSQDHDLLLRATERARRVVHVGGVLYSWKQVPGSAALQVDEKPAAWTAGLRAVQDALERRGGGAEAVLGPSAGLFEVHHPVPPGSRVSVVLHGGAPSSQRLAQLTRHAGVDDVEWLTAEGSHPADLNRAAAAAAGDVLVFLDANLVPRPKRGPWLRPLVEQALRGEVGVVGGRLLQPGGDPWEEGLHVEADGTVSSVGSRHPVLRRTAAVSAACLATRRDLFNAGGGFDEGYMDSLFDVDLCLRLRDSGHAVVYTPMTELRRLSAHRRRPAGAADLRRFRSRWAQRVAALDPHTSPWLASVRPLQFRP